MKALVFAVLLTVMQAAPPVPRKAADNNAAKEKKQAAAPTQPIVNSVASEPNENNSRPIIIRELPPVTIATDWWNKGYVIFTGALVLFGGVGVWVAFRAAQAAKISADAIINSERAWVLVETARIRPVYYQTSAISPVVKNFGKTIARSPRDSALFNSQKNCHRRRYMAAHKNSTLFCIQTKNFSLLPSR